MATNEEQELNQRKNTPANSTEGYKRFIKSREARKKILYALDWVPDKQMVALQYRIKLGRWPNLRYPQRYSEKLQWYKLNYRDPIMSECADKYSVREFVRHKGFEHILNECYGVWDDPSEIDWKSLPNEFVLKDTLGGGGVSMVFVHDKDEADKRKLLETLRFWTEGSRIHKDTGREWVYEGRKHRILAERILVGDADGDLPDYKFFCFDGNVFCLYMMQNYTMHHEEGVLGFFDRDFKLLPVHRADFKPMLKQPDKPENYEEMVDIAEALSKDFPHVRVDLYNLDGKILFGEMTFFNASGYVVFEPDDFDFELGKQFKLPDAKVF